MPIRLRLALLFSLAAAVAVSVGGLVFTTELSGGLRSSVETSLQVRAADLVQQLPDAAGPGGLQVGNSAPAPNSPTGADTEELTQVIGPGGRVLDSSGFDTNTPVLSSAQLAEARHRGTIVESHVGSSNDHILLLAVPASPSGTVVVVGQSLSTVDEAVSGVILAISVGGVVAVVGAALAAWLVAGAALRPVERMRRQAAEISENDADAQLSVPHSGDEIAALGHTLNELLHRLHGALSRQRGFAAAAGHELRTPLAVLKAELELAGHPDHTNTDLSEAIGRAAAETDRVIDLAHRLLLLAQGDEGGLQLAPFPTDLRQLASEAADAFGAACSASGVTLRIDAPDPVVAAVDPAAYRQILDNLLSNALRHGGPGSTIVVSLDVLDGAAVLAVADEGPGFPPGFLPRAFDRFSRSDDSRSGPVGGAGLGLAIVKSLAEAQGGRASAANLEHRGAVVTVEVPICSDQSSVARARAMRPSPTAR